LRKRSETRDREMEEKSYFLIFGCLFLFSG
jgi:hypothetical protein